ncbi:MAG: 30S ribosomal protein S2 [Alphaproteobacteria bacterium]
MALPTFTIRQLLESGVHFGHSTRRWNPKMQPWLFGERNGVHIIDLQQTAPLLYRAMQAVEKTVASGGRVLFVGTKRQASPIIAEAARKSGQYFVNHRWLGGMLTNWKTVSNSIRRLRELEELTATNMEGLTKKEQLQLNREKDKLELVLGGIKDMGGLPDIIVIVDTNKEAIAIQEANNLNIPVVGVLDSNSDPEGIDYPVPGNDDAIRAISLYCDLLAGSVLSGIQEEIVEKGGDIGEAEDVSEAALSEEKPVEKTTETTEEVAEVVEAEETKTES